MSGRIWAMQIEVFADIICPWCYIGWHRLARALAARPLITTHLVWRPFQLYPEGLTHRLPIRRIDPTRIAACEAAAEESLPIRPERIGMVVNTLAAHRLILHAQASGQGPTMIATLMRAHFVDAVDLSDRTTLLRLAASVGVNGAGAFNDPTPGLGVGIADDLARQLGLQAVPSFIFDHRFAISGALDTLSFLPLLGIDIGRQSTAPGGQDV